ncbi:hypothetical protein CC99x_011765 [Candidatus Berkiella cookevillensis]|uniref:Uncharacterized protein n=1 Tax=Candidatus Berkiella cookevillensis TaxID=437022 RepID=A0A0Q9YAT1_9GAMM|nr:hypothetical protein [Candidatus Berkiella cookevillensis]MCS5709572.1 hypothetical protein [Candidatus Berkiella cookevillensis]
MTQGKSLIIHLFILLLLGASLGLVFVYHQYFQQQLTDKHLALDKAQTEIRALENEIRQIKASYAQATSPEAKAAQAALYAQQLEKMAQEKQNLQKNYDALNLSLTECQTTHAAGNLSSPNSNTATEQSSQALPLEAPLSPTPQSYPEPGKSDNTISTINNMIEKDHFECPIPRIVNSHLDTGQWSDIDMKWWVDFTFRPLRDDEEVKKPFQALFDGIHVDCYYRIGPAHNEEEISNTWIVIKGVSTHKAITPNNAWQPCEVEGCERRCEYENGTSCSFELIDKQ